MPLEAAVESYSCLKDDIFESTNFDLLLLATTLVELSMTPLELYGLLGLLKFDDYGYPSLSATKDTSS